MRLNKKQIDKLNSLFNECPCGGVDKSQAILWLLKAVTWIIVILIEQGSQDETK